jgi:para-nitrobenzyl esterase
LTEIRQQRCHKAGAARISAIISALLVTLLLSRGAVATEVVFDKIYAGSQSEGVYAFLGVPFAQAARWEPPSPLSDLDLPQDGKVSAANFPPACMQTNHIVNWYRELIKDFGGAPESFPAPSMSESCLYLNIWTPTLDTTEALPVVVYLHGGSNKGGWSFEPNYLGHELAKKGLVVISVNYRLGIFGFFAHPNIPDPNFALLDQLAALEWVARYAENVGGSKNNVILMGESAGASNIDFILASPKSQGLVHKAIHQSAGWAINGRVDRQDMQKLALKLTSQLTNEGNDLAQLKTLDAQSVLEAAQTVYDGVFFDPVPGTPSLPNPAKKAFDNQSITPVDLLIGSNADEWLMYLNDEARFETTLTEWVAEDKRERVKALMAGYSEREAMDTLITAANYVCPSFQIASVVRAQGKKAWFYLFDRIREGELASKMGAYHGAELPYVFDTHDDWLPTNDIDEQLTEQMMTYWAQFAKTGNPNTAELPEWPLFNLESKRTIRLDNTVRATPHPSAELCSVLLEK